MHFCAEAASVTSAARRSRPCTCCMRACRTFYLPLCGRTRISGAETQSPQRRPQHRQQPIGRHVGVQGRHGLRNNTWIRNLAIQGATSAGAISVWSCSADRAAIGRRNGGGRPWGRRASSCCADAERGKSIALNSGRVVACLRLQLARPPRRRRAARFEVRIAASGDWGW